MLDLAIVGGGPAGMSAALIAGRALLDTVVINAEMARTHVTGASHGFLTRDGAHPSEILAVAKSQLEKYETVTYRVGVVAGIERHTNGFEITDDTGNRIMAERLIIATGHRDDLAQLSIEGIENVYGNSVYPCVFCDGLEHHGERIALFGGADAVHYAPMVSMWTRDLTVFTNGRELSASSIRELELRGVAVHRERIVRLHASHGTLASVELSSGERIERDAGFIADDYSTPATAFAQELGVGSRQNDWGMTELDADDLGKTSVDNLWVIGDAKTGFSGLIAAAAEGAACAESIVHTIAADRWAASD